MKRLLIILLLAVTGVRSNAQIDISGEVDVTFDASSYDLTQLLVLGPVLATWIINEDPLHTNSWNSVSRSGASWQNQFEQQQAKYCPMWWCYAYYTNGVVPYDLILANDNGAYNSNSVNQWGTNLFNAPGIMWNGTAKTNEGFTGLQVVHITVGANVADAADGDSGAISRNAGAMKLNTLAGLLAIDLWHDTWTNGWSSDVTVARWLGFDKYKNGHANAAGFLMEAISIGRQLGLRTNFGSITFDFGGASVSASNGFAATGLALTGGALSGTLKADRMPPSWDRVAIISNDVTDNIWKAAPSFGNILRWTITITNFPHAGTYGLYLDGVLWDSATDLEWAHGRNEATNAAPNVSFNWQRDQTLHDVLDKYGVDYRSRTNTHTAGETGAHGLNDLIRWQSHAGAWPTTHGPALVNALGQDVVDGRAFDVIAHNDAQQTNHTFMVTPLSPTTVTNLSIGTLHLGQVRTQHVWFVNGTNWPESDNWVNNCDFIGVATTTNLGLPFAQWKVQPAELENYQRHLGVKVVSTEPQLFCRAVFHQSKGAQ